jgi:hypothetical protein
MGSIGKITVPPRAWIIITGYLNAINEEVIKKSKYKML